MFLLIFSVFIFLSILVLAMFFINIDYKDIKKKMQNKRLQRIRKLSKEDLIRQQFRRDLKNDIEENKTFIKTLENKLLFIRAPIVANDFIIISLVSGLIGFAAAYFFFELWYIATMGFLVSLTFPFLIVMNLEAKIITNTNKHTKKFIDLCRETSIGANNALDAIKNTIQQLKEPLKTLIKDVVTQAESGTTPIENSFHQLAVTMHNDYLLLFSIALKKQKENGTDFRQALSNVYSIIEKDDRIKRKNRIETKYSSRSFMFLVVFYIFELVVIRLMFPTAYNLLVTNPIGKMTLVMSLILIIINLVGVIWVFRK